MNLFDFKPIHVLGGQSAACADPDTVLVTVLGSCISACIYDPVAGVGGMNHFVLPTGGFHEAEERRHRFGDVAMRMLVDDLFSLGARPRNLKVKLYGGRARTSGGSDTGAMNAAFARRFVETEGIPLVASSTGEDHARWITFHPATGRVWLKLTSGIASSIPLTARGILVRSALHA